MFESLNLLTFVIASVFLSLAPGPDNIFVLTQSALYGRNAGLLITLGLCTGLVVHTTLIAFGVGVLFQDSSLAFTVLKTLGAAYLGYLAWQAFRAASANIEGAGQPRLTPGRLYRRGIFMNITNPKVTVFFLAFLPQFAVPEQGQLSFQLCVLGIVFIAVAWMVFSLVALLAAQLGDWLKSSPGAQRKLNLCASAALCLLAINLLLSNSLVS